MRHPRALAGGCAGVVAATLLGTSPAALADVPSAVAPGPAAQAATASTTSRTPVPATAPEAAYPRQPQLRVFPDEPTDVSLARGATPYDDIAPRLQALMDRSPYVSTEVVGQSTLGRDLYLVTVTAPETAAEATQQATWRDAIKHSPVAAAADPALLAGYKTPIWFNNNIHGNEWEGADASLNRIEELADAAASGDTGAQDLLAGTRLYFTITNNPDGRVLGQRRTALDLDPNRDFITSTTPETRAIRDLSARIQPVFFSDIHGYTGVLQVEPCGPPHGENYDYDLFLPHAYASALKIEQDVVAADIPGNTYRAEDGSVTTENTGSIQIPYRDIRSGWDDWPPIFTAQYVAFQGAVTSTVELPLGRVDLTTPEGRAENARRSAVDVQVAEQVITSTVDYATTHAGELLANQIEIFRRGAAGEPLREIGPDPDPTQIPGPDQWADVWDETDVYRATFPRAYVIPTGEEQRSETSAATLVDQLLAHGVEVRRTLNAFSVDGTRYPAGSYYVDMHQPLRGMANVLLAPGRDISDRIPDMYDVSAWSLGELWGADVAAVTTRGDRPPAVRARPVAMAAPTGSAPRGTPLRLALTGVAEVRAVNALLADGIAVTYLPDGSAALRRDAWAAAAEVAQRYGVAFERTTPAVLRDPAARALRPLRVGYVSASATEGEDRLVLEDLGFSDLVQVTAEGLGDGTVDLSSVDILWVGDDLELTPDARAALEQYVAGGGGLVGRGTAAGDLASTLGYVDATSVQGARGGNGIVAVRTPRGSVLATTAEDRAFVYAPVWFTDLGGTTRVEQRYATGDPLVAGHWRPSTADDGEPAPADGPSAAAGQASVISGTAPSGAEAVVFGTYPTFRTHPRGMFDDVARALLAVATVADAPVAASAAGRPEAAPTPEPKKAGTQAPPTQVRSGGAGPS